MPQPRPDAPEQAARSAARARWSVAASGAVIGAISLHPEPRPEHAPCPSGRQRWRRLLGAGEAAGAGGNRIPRPAAPSDAASPEELKQNWPRFRGADGGGVSPLTNVPATWDVKTGAGIAWKVPAPASGFNSPIVWGDRVFFSGGDAQQARGLLSGWQDRPDCFGGSP